MERSSDKAFLHSTVDENINGLSKNLKSVVSACKNVAGMSKGRDKSADYVTTMDDLLITNASNQMLETSRELLQMIATLKKTALLYDFTEMTTQISSRHQKASERTYEESVTITNFKTDLKNAIRECESALSEKKYPTSTN
mmetsp:Transcript_14169/g.15629  ORF Transcript_14169/g.15629 Transcript_14169/m.15629 type:complete len:141 (-) Transcript_14169:68-490(-)